MKGFKQKMAAEYLDKFPQHGKKTVARKMYKDNPEVFKDVEQARATIRRVTGSHGKLQRKIITDKSYFKNDDYMSWNKIPEGEKTLDWDNPLQINCKSALVISDIHVPYHSKEALEIALEYGYKKGADVIYINGDFIDCYQLSRWVRDPRMRSFADELHTAKSILKLIADSFPGVKLYYKMGNHDYRYELYMKLKAPELLDIADFEFKNILGLDSLGYAFVGNKEWSKINGLPVMHGHEGGQSFTNPVNPARGVFLKAVDSVLIGHHHQPSSHTSKTLRGKAISTFSTGCLCDLNPEYMPLNKHTWGFAMINMEDDGFDVDNRRIINGKARSV